MRIPDISKYKLIVFDLDGTLAPSKSPMHADMGKLLFDLVKIKKVAVISGGAFHQFETQFLKHMPVPHSKESHVGNLSNLLLLPTSGTRMYTWKGSWHEEYAEVLSPTEKTRILSALQASLKQAGYHEPKVFGPVVEDRDSQITFSALGQNAPIEFKEKWDPDQKKRKHIISFLEKKIEGFDLRMGGTTSIDITKRGVNKAYGIHKLENMLGLGPSDILFVGDALYPGGNDHPARATGVDCIQVSGPDETKHLLEAWTS